MAQEKEIEREIDGKDKWKEKSPIEKRRRKKVKKFSILFAYQKIVVDLGVPV